jgi:hypothetical protein
MAIGIASKVASVVPIAAIATVSAVRNKKNGTSSIVGGHACEIQCQSFGNPAASFARSTWAKWPAKR